MAHWAYTVQFKHLLTRNDDHESVQSSMNAIADVCSSKFFFNQFNFKPFRKIAKGDGVITPTEYANILLDRLFDYCDQNRIWVK